MRIAVWPLSSLIRRRKKPAFSREASFAARPVRNPAIEWDQESDADDLVLTVPRRKTRGANSVAWLLGVPSERRVQLDELGSFVWRRCDGASTVRDLIDALKVEYKLSQREATVSLTTYLQTLGKRNLVAFAVDKALLEDEKGDRKHGDEPRAVEEGATAVKKNPQARRGARGGRKRSRVRR